MIEPVTPHEEAGLAWQPLCDAIGLSATKLSCQVAGSYSAREPPCSSSEANMQWVQWFRHMADN